MRANNIISIKVALSGRSLDSVRYAAYAVSDRAFVLLRKAGKRAVLVNLSPRTAAASSGLRASFLSELADEKLRETVSDANRGLREFLILKALSEADIPRPEASDAGLTAEQEKELEEMIAQVEREIKLEGGAGKKRDPLGITRTWEDKYGSKKGRKKR